VWWWKPYVASKVAVTRDMDATMSQKTKKEVLEKLRRSYRLAGPAYRRKLIDQAVELVGYHRKAAIRALAAPPVERPAVPGIIGRPRIYEPALLMPALKTIWLIGQQPCGKRLATMMPEWVPAYEAYHRSLPNSIRERLLEASPATLDRLLRGCRAEHGKPSAGTKPGTMLRQSIPIRGGAWQEDEPGWTEADTVSMCGGCVAGEHIWIVDNTDICTTWVEMRAMHGRGQHSTVEQLQDMEKSQPFTWLGLDSDNGGEFINRHVLKWCQQGRSQPIYYTRSRPYRSNDNAHVEQKNWTHVRHWFGYERHDNPEVALLINALNRAELGQFVNLFSPSMKLERKEQTTTGKEHRIYGQPATPYARVLACPAIAPEKKEQLRLLKEKLNPFALEASIQKQLKKIHRIRRALE
jgi:hypothetical protein